MSYELKNGETVADLIDYAAGFTGDAYTKNIRLTRKNGSEYQLFTINEPDYSTFQLLEGDALSVGAMLDRFENRIEIKGAIFRPGTYELGDEINSVKTLIAKAEGIKGDAFTNRALITREREDLTLEILPVDIGAILAGTADDVPLIKNDILYIPSIHDLEDIGNITVEGEVAKPGVFVYADNVTLEDAIMMAGGLLESASTVKIDVNRRIKNPTSVSPSDVVGQVFTFSFKDGYILDGEAGFVLEPYDYIIVRKSPGYEDPRFVKVTGEVAFPGNYVMSKKEERISDLVAKAGGLTKWAYVKGARLQRQIIGEEKVRMESTEELLKSAKDSINMDLLDQNSRYFVGIDLQAALDNPGSDADLVLREGDVLGVPEYINTVKISGNVMYPNVVTYNPKMTVKDYVTMAGGYGYRSKKSKAYIIYLNGTLAKARRHSSSIVEPGCEIVIPQKKDKKNGLQEYLSIATTTTSIATMIATIANILR
jgi:protein involved in polysaccharide export with SLBB domain